MIFIQNIVTALLFSPIVHEFMILSISMGERVINITITPAIMAPQMATMDSVTSPAPPPFTSPSNPNFIFLPVQGSYQIYVSLGSYLFCHNCINTQFPHVYIQKRRLKLNHQLWPIYYNIKLICMSDQYFQERIQHLSQSIYASHSLTQQYQWYW